MSGQGGGGGALGALLFVIGLLALFCVLFTTFLVIPFFIFLAGIVAMVVSDRRRAKEEASPEPQPPQRTAR